MADRAVLTPVRLRIRAATIWLPEAELTESDDERDDEPHDDERREGWSWSSGDLLHLQTGGCPGLPRLRSLVGHGPDGEHALLAGRPVSVHRYTELEEDAWLTPRPHTAGERWRVAGRRRASKALAQDAMIRDFGEPAAARTPRFAR
jgi:hypothetical protein